MMQMECWNMLKMNDRYSENRIWYFQLSEIVLLRNTRFDDCKWWHATRKSACKRNYGVYLHFATGKKVEELWKSAQSINDSFNSRSRNITNLTNSNIWPRGIIVQLLNRTMLSISVSCSFIFFAFDLIWEFTYCVFQVLRQNSKWWTKQSLSPF